MPKVKEKKTTAKFKEPIVAKMYDEIELIPQDKALPYEKLIPWPVYFKVSGLYEWSWNPFRPILVNPPIKAIPVPYPGVQSPNESVEAVEEGMGELTAENRAKAFLPNFPWLFKKEELRLDVDGRYPQDSVSGTVYLGKSVRVHWIASLNKFSSNKWSGNIWYKDGNTASFPYTQVQIATSPSFYWNQRKATATFSGGGAATLILLT